MEEADMEQDQFTSFGGVVTETDGTKWSELSGDNVLMFEEVEIGSEQGEETLLMENESLDLLASLNMSQSDEKPSTSYSVEPAIHTEDIQKIISSGEITLPKDFPSAELTLQYLSGQISFVKFSELMELSEVGDKMEEDTEATTGNTSEVYVDIEKSADIYGDDLEEATSQQSESDDTVKKRRYRKKTTVRKRKRRQTDLPKHLEGLMGEANIKYARGEHDEAIKMCLEIIKIAPKAILPFQTLGMLYETIGDTKKSMQFYLIAAYLNPSDAEEWVRLAEMSLEQNDLNQAIMCYTRAVKADRTNVQYLWERCKLYEEIGEQNKVMEGYEAILKVLPPEKGVQYFELARILSKYYHEQDDKVSAMRTMKNAFTEHPDQVTAEDVNLLLELQMSQKLFIQALEVLVIHCGLTFVFDNGNTWTSDSLVNTQTLESGQLKITQLSFPDMIPIDLRVKLAVCLIHQKLQQIVKAVIEPLFDEDIEDTGDLYLDIAEAYMDNLYYLDAKPILQQLVCSANYNLAAVWLKFAECLSALNDIENAVQAFSRVVELAPAHVGARMSLSSLQQRLGKHEEAIQALSKEDVDKSVTLTKQEQILLLHKCNLLYSQGRHDEFLVACKQLLFDQFRDITKLSFVSAIFSYKTAKNKKECMHDFLKDGVVIGKSDLPVDDLWDLFVKLCDLLYSEDRLDDLLEVTTLGMASPYFYSDERKMKQAEFMCLFACLKTKNGHVAFSFVRDMCVRDPDNQQVWNLFNQILLVSAEKKHNRFCLRFLLSHPDHIPICLLNGHNASASGTYIYALSEYVSVFRRIPKDPMISLCIGVNFVHLAAQKFSAKKHFLLTQGIAFLNNYLELRGECQEPYYNIGRGLHVLGLTYAAVHHYQKVLQMKPAIEDEKGTFDLRREAAYNLVLIYKASGSKELAQYITDQYLVI